MEKKKQPSVKAGSFGCGQVDKKRSAGVGTFTFDDIFEPRT